MYYLGNLLIFDIPLLYYHTNLNSSLICCLLSGDVYFCISLWTSSFSEYKEDFFECIILLAILFPFKSPVASAVFYIALFEAVFIASVVDFFALSRRFCLYLLFKFLGTLVACVLMFLVKDKNPFYFLLHIFYL